MNEINFASFCLSLAKSVKWPHLGLSFGFSAVLRVFKNYCLHCFYGVSSFSAGCCLFFLLLYFVLLFTVLLYCFTDTRVSC